MRVLSLVLVLAALMPAGSRAARTASSPSPSPVPEDVRIALAQLSIGLSSPADVSPSGVRVSYEQAPRIARARVGWMIRPFRSSWMRVDRTTIHLVRLAPPPALPDRRGFVSTAPLRISDLAWLAVFTRCDDSHTRSGRGQRAGPQHVPGSLTTDRAPRLAASRDLIQPWEARSGGGLHGSPPLTLCLMCRRQSLSPFAGRATDWGDDQAREVSSRPSGTSRSQHRR